MSPPGIWEHLDTLSCYTAAAATVNWHRCESSKVGLGKWQEDEEKIEKLKTERGWGKEENGSAVLSLWARRHCRTAASTVKRAILSILDCFGLNIMLAWEFVHVHGTIIPRRAPWGCAALRRDGELRRVKDTNKLWKFESNTTFWTTFKL